MSLALSPGLASYRAVLNVGHAPSPNRDISGLLIFSFGKGVSPIKHGKARLIMNSYYRRVLAPMTPAFTLSWLGHVDVTTLK